MDFSLFLRTIIKILGFFVVLIAAIIGYKATIEGTTIPIEATQTAEARQTENANQIEYARLTEYVKQTENSKLTEDRSIIIQDQSLITDNSIPDIPLVEIVFIDYSPLEKLDEYVELKSNSETDIDMRNWTLSDKAGWEYKIEFDFVLKPGETVKIWTKTGINTDSDLYWGRGSCVWNNDFDTAYLKDRTGSLIDNYSYGP
jgi:hypothetical protein